MCYKTQTILLSQKAFLEVTGYSFKPQKGNCLILCDSDILLKDCCSHLHGSLFVGVNEVGFAF